MHRPKTYTLDEAQKRMEQYCAYQERCHQEVTKKLYAMRMIPEARDKIIVHLLEHNFLNEERFTKTFVLGKFRIKKWGRKRLELELKRREISAYNIKLAFKEISDAEYLEAFNQLAEKKVAQIKESNLQKKRKKLADYLLYRGWETHLVYDKVNELI
ncbi:regulatory protein RecX [Gaetbulibacter sp. PBL-D1]|uniref:regulatory protein RecX n=1 Tax=Gaetbulibacter sp. PBL-D1 TaxID=3422594 RepID=UPI003D2F132C